MHDVVCVGFGPANIALAVALDELWPTARVKFLERAPGPCRQPSMLTAGAGIRNNLVRDLASPRNPRSRYTFVNYLHEQGRLVKHHPSRKEYAQYVMWVAQNVPADVDYGQEVTRIGLAADGTVEVESATGTVYGGRSIVVAPGRSPFVPAVFAGLPHPSVVHVSQYLTGIADLPAHFDGTLAVVGAGRSAIEVVLALIGRFPAARVVNVMSGSGYRLMETGPFAEEVDEDEDRLRPTNDSSVGRDIIDALYLRMYEDELDGRQRVSMRTNRSITAADPADSGAVAITTTSWLTGERERFTVDRAILATGYLDVGVPDRAAALPPLLAGLAEALHVDAGRGLAVGADYRVGTGPGRPPVYLNGVCGSARGLGDAGSFSLLARRSEAIVRSLRRGLAEVDEVRSPRIVQRVASLTSPAFATAPRC